MCCKNIYNVVTSVLRPYEEFAGGMLEAERILRSGVRQGSISLQPKTLHVNAPEHFSFSQHDVD